MSIRIRHVDKTFRNIPVLHDINLDVQTGELIALLGPSGSGKTTLLRVIAGLEMPDQGTIWFDGIEARQTFKEHRVGFVFQHYALFKHMSVFDNVAFGLRVRPKETRPTNDDIVDKVMTMLELVHLDAFANHMPAQLSGGQRQRVALARSLAVEPNFLLLDEPFGALDSKVRKELRRWMRKLHDTVGLTSIFVTHDQEEAMEVADRVVVMNQGVIEQIGTPSEVYHQPANPFIYDFLGNFNIFEGWRDKHDKIHITDYEQIVEELEESALPSPWWKRYGVVSKVLSPILKHTAHEDMFKPHTKRSIRTVNKPLEGSKPIKIFARPHDIQITREKDDEEYVLASVIHINQVGALVKVELERANGSIIQAEIAKDTFRKLELNLKDEVFVRPQETMMFE